MEAEVTAIASRSTRKLDYPMHCVSCGIHKFWTPKRWDCEVCGDYFLCDDCYIKGSQDKSEVLSAPPQVHCGDHPLSAHVTTAICDGCGSSPIWNVRWQCKVCLDFDLCEACHGRLDAWDMPQEHSKEHPMISIPVICRDEMLKLQPSFNKPVDPQWSYKVDDDLSSYGFEWVKRKPMVLRQPILGVLNGVDDDVNHTLGNANEENSVPSSKQKEQINFKCGNLLSKQASLKLKATQIQRNASKCRILDKKHKVFLSHAGAEKDFVEQLYQDLSKVHHFGIFFDKDDESLPKGEPFPSNIFDAAKHCELAIVVVSHEYFIRKWPMLELATFVEAQETRPELKILPVFYKLSVEEFKEQQASFWTSWKEMGLVSEDEMEKWKEALKVISRTNGLEYNKKIGEVSFRDCIVKTVSKLVNLELIWDDSHVQGKTQMQETIEEVIQLSSNARGEVPFSYTLRMGLFGMGGAGKSTMCRVFCNQVVGHYLGKVCHIEFGSMRTLLHLRLKLLQRLCQLASSLLQTIDEGEALTLLKTHIPKQRVCLIIDNVSDDHAIIEEARTLLNLPFKEGSLILVTSRSSIVLESLKIEKRFTMRVPSLATKEARTLFSHHAGCDSSSLTKEQMKAMENFVERCNFKVKGMASQEYHPLALKVLGSQLGPNVEEWESIRIDFKSYENENTHPIFSILRSSFDSLNLEYQRIFLDIALHYSNSNVNLRMVGLEWQVRCLYGETDKQFSPQVVKVLQAKSLVEFYDVVERTIYIHDLYREFARMEVKRKGMQHSQKCCFSRGSRHQHAIQERRVRIHDHLVSHITKDILSCTICSEAELLVIQDCANLVSIDVPGMENLLMFEVIGGCPQLRSVNLEGAVNLKSLCWEDFEGEYPNITSLESLERLFIISVVTQSCAILHGCLDFSRSSNLERLTLSCLPLNLLNLNQAVQLKWLDFLNCQHLERFEGLEALVQLEHIRMKSCSSLLEFPSLASFPSLDYFRLKGAGKLKVIHGFANLTALRVLSLVGGKELEALPGIEACTRLSSLDLSGTCIRDCSWISVMKELTCINLSRTKIKFVPCCNSLCKLSELWLDDCQALVSIGDKLGSTPATFPQSLQEFSAEKCRSLSVVPQFHYESAIHYLDLEGTCVEDVYGVMCCKQLLKLFLGETRITSLPDLSSLTRLETLDVHGCELLVSIGDNTASTSTTFPQSLQEFNAKKCRSLSAVPQFHYKSAIHYLNLEGTCVEDVSGVMCCKQLLKLFLRETRITSLPNLSSLTRLEVLYVDGCELLVSIGDNTGSTSTTFPQSLQKFSAEKCRSLSVVPQFHYKSAIHYLNLVGTCVEDVSGMMCCKQLQKLFLRETRITSLPNLSSLTRLEVLYVDGCELLVSIGDNTGSTYTTFPQSLQEFSAEKCRSLSVVPQFPYESAIHYLYLEGTCVEDVSGVMCCKQLQKLILRETRITSLPNLSSLTRLEVLYVDGCELLVSIGDNTGSTHTTFPQSLQEFSAEKCRSLSVVPQFHYESAMHYLDLEGICVEDVSGVMCCKQLQKLFLGETRITSLPDLSSLTRLEVLDVHGCELLVSIGDNTGSTPTTFPQSLQEFRAEKCRSLSVVPQFHYESAIHYLDLEGTCVEDVSGVMCCKQLQKLFLGETHITSLPDLSSLTRLEALDVYGCELLAKMDHIKSLPALENLRVYGCTSLLALPDLRSSTRLTNLSLYDCPLVDPNTVKLPKGSTVDMDMEDAANHNQYSDNDVEAQECEGETSALTDFQASELSQNPGDLQHSSTWWQWAGSLWRLWRKDGKRRLVS